MSEIVKLEAAHDAPSTSLTPMEMLGKLIERGGDIEVMSKMLDLQERWQASEERRRKQEAERAYAKAMSELRSALPTIYKTGKGNNNSRYATLSDLTGALDEVISQYGLSFRFSTDSERPGQVVVTCIVAHADGHSERTTLSGAPDKSGSKNDIQSIGSVLTYLRRYTLEAAFGLAASVDDDGSRAGGQRPQEQRGPELRQEPERHYEPEPEPFDPGPWLTKIAGIIGADAETKWALRSEIDTAIKSGAIPQAFRRQIKAAFAEARDAVPEEVDAEVVE